jgi:hypothetical protein
LFEPKETILRGTVERVDAGHKYEEDEASEKEDLTEHVDQED